MTFSAQGFERVDSKEIEKEHTLLKLRHREKGIFLLVLAKNEAQSGTLFGGHNWEEIGQHPSVVGDFFDQIDTIADFQSYSSKVRCGIQELIEGGKI